MFNPSNSNHKGFQRPKRKENRNNDDTEIGLGVSTQDLSHRDIQPDATVIQLNTMLVLRVYLISHASPSQSQLAPATPSRLPHFHL